MNRIFIGDGPAPRWAPGSIGEMMDSATDEDGAGLRFLRRQRMSEKSRRKQYGEIASALAGLDVFVAPAIMVDEALDIDEGRSLERLAWLLEEAHTEAAKLKHGGWER